MAEGNGTTLRVDLLGGDAELVGAPQALAGESLVDLEDVNVVLGDAGQLEDLGDGLPGANAHEKGRDADDGGGDELAQDGLAELLGGRALHQEDSSSAIADLAGIAGVDGAVLGEGRADLGKGLNSNTLTDTVILVDEDLLGLAGLGVGVLGLDGVDLLLEKASLLGRNGLLERSGGEGILLGAGDVAVFGHLLREDTHGNLAVGSLGMALKELRKLADGTRAVLSGHGLNPSTDSDLDHAAADRVGNIDASLQTRRALAVEGVDGSGDGEAGDQGSGTHLGGTTAGGKDGADNDIFDELGLDLGALKDAFQGTGQEVRGKGVLEGALAALGDGRPESAGDDDLG